MSYAYLTDPNTLRHALRYVDMLYAGVHTGEREGGGDFASRIERSCSRFLEIYRSCLVNSPGCIV